MFENVDAAPAYQAQEIEKILHWMFTSDLNAKPMILQKQASLYYADAQDVRHGLTGKLARFGGKLH